MTRMTYDTSYRIEKFGERLAWMIDHVEHNHLCFGDPNKPLDKPTSVTAIYRALCELLPGKIVKLPTWEKYLSGETSTSLAVMLGLREIYPSMPFEVLTTGTFADFEVATAQVTAARNRWADATKHVASHRDELAKLAKQYYQTVDASHDYRPVEDGPVFPLITQPGWLLEEPVLLTETDPVAKLQRHIDDAKGFELAGWKAPYWMIKKALMGIKSGARLTNGPTFRVSEISADGRKINLKYSCGWYFNYIDTCEALGAELADFAIHNAGKVPGPDDLPLRGEPERVFDFRNRSAFPGVNCLLILKNYFEGTNSDERKRMRDEFLMHFRPGTTLEAQNTWHVVPAGGHQPLTDSFVSDEDQSLWRSAVREFVEEVFNKEEAAKYRKSGVSFLDHPEVKPIVDKVFRKDGVAKIYLMGMGLDPVTTKLEILVAIVVDWKKFMTRAEGLKIEANYEGKIVHRELTKDMLLAAATRGEDGRPVLPAGSACLLMAHKFLDRLKV